MADPRFFTRSGPFTLAELAAIAGAEIAPGVDAGARYVSVAALDQAEPEHVSFLDNRKYIYALADSRAGACILRPDDAPLAPAGMALLVTPKPYHAYAKVAAAFHGPRPVAAGVSDKANVAGGAEIAEDAAIAAGAAIGEDVRIGRRSAVGANAVILDGVTIGEDCVIGPNVTLQCCDLGDRVVVHPGVRIGQDGFGFAMDADGHEKVPQLGRVRIGNDTEIGANATIDRGAGPDTIIGAGCKIDNLVQIGHNAVIGDGCVIVAQVGISGSTSLGRFVVVGGQGGLAGHLKIGDGAQIAAQSGVTRDIEAGGKVGGTPAQPMTAWLRGAATLQRLARRGK